MTAYIIPALLLFSAVYASSRKRDVFSAMTKGAKNGLAVMGNILPSLVVMMTAISMLPAKGRLGNVMPNARAMIAPRDAPEDTPMVVPSARGFFKRPCIAAPHTDRDAPTRVTHSTRGRRTVGMMLAARLPAG